MRILIANESKQSLGGGWTFLRNFEKYAKRQAAQLSHLGDGSDFGTGDIFFIAGATMVKREDVQRAKDAGMKIVLRVDNAPKNSRNRNTGTSRLQNFAQMADLVIYQSEWARSYLSPWLQKDGPVILNGADPEIFNRDVAGRPKDGDPQFLFAQYNRDETKRWPEAWYEFQMAARQWPGSHLWIVGNFSQENVEYNFDFFMGEKFEYVGVLEDPADFAEHLRATDWLLLPYYNDACSNTLIEARLCGVEKIHYSPTGGNPEIMQSPIEILSAEHMAKQYLANFAKL
jgi:glycosyltransferase involved in cell wall biosynthesis